MGVPKSRIRIYGSTDESDFYLSDISTKSRIIGLGFSKKNKIPKSTKTRIRTSKIRELVEKTRILKLESRTKI